MKTDIYTWRVSPDVKEALQREAQREKATVAAVLDRLARQWLDERRTQLAGDDGEQRRLHAQASRFIGQIAGDNPMRAESARSLVRERLAAKRAKA